MTPKTIVIADDDPMVRKALTKLLSNHPEYQVIAEAEDGRKAVDAVLSNRPDLAILDLRMPNMTGIEATAAINRQAPEIPVLMLTAHAEPMYLFQSVQAGAAGYVLKEASEQQLISKIEDVLSGEPVLEGHLVRRFMLQAKTIAPPRAPVPFHKDRANLVAGAVEDIEPLSPRELETLTLIADGRTNDEIAQTLYVSVHTVKTYVENIIRKLHASDRTQAACIAVRSGLLDGSLAYERGLT